MSLKNLIPKPVKQKISSTSLYREKIKKERFMMLRNQILKDFPYAIIIELTNKCNLTCRMCPRPNMKDLDIGDIDIELYKKIIDDISNNLNKSATLTPVGLGDPLFYPHLSEAIIYAKEKCPGIPIIFDMNGILLNKSNSLLLVNLLNNIGDRLLISLNSGTPETYKWLMGDDKFDLVVENIKTFLEIRKSNGVENPRLIIQILETAKTKDEVQQFKKDWSPLIEENDLIHVRPLVNWSGEINLDELEIEENTIEKNRIIRYPCYNLWTTISIDKNGNIYPCCIGLSSREKGSLSLGNIKDKPLREVYFGTKLNTLRELHLSGQWDKIPDCKGCDFWTGQPNIWYKKKMKNKQIKYS